MCVTIKTKKGKFLTMVASPENNTQDVDVQGGSGVPQENRHESYRMQEDTATVAVEEERGDTEIGSLPVIVLSSNSQESIAECNEAADTQNEGSPSGEYHAEAQIVNVQANSDDGNGYESEKEIVALPIEEDPQVSDTQSTRSSETLRAEFISATVIKETEDTPIGMGLVSEDGEVLISSIQPETLIAKTPFRVGDRLLSVNNKRCYILDSQEVDEYIANLVGNVTLVVHNGGGDPNMVESMVFRPRNRQCGLGLKSSGRRRLRISSIDEKGLFVDSLLTVGDPILSINGENCQTCDAHRAKEIMDQAPGDQEYSYITVKARTLLETGIVVAAFSCTNSTGSTIPPELMEALNRPRERSPSVKRIAALALLAVVLVAILLTTGFFA